MNYILASFSVWVLPAPNWSFTCPVSVAYKHEATQAKFPSVKKYICLTSTNILCYPVQVI